MADYGSILGWLITGFIYGHLLGSSRRAEKHDDVGLRLLSDMVFSVRAKRRMVGPYLTITRDEHLDLNGERFTISVRSEGNPAAKWEDA